MKHWVNCWDAKGNQGISYANQQPSHAKCSSNVEGSETRTVSSTSNNLSQERPAPFMGDDIVRHSEEIRRVSLNDSHNSCEEYNQLVSYGAADAGAFVREGELPQTRDTNYARRTALVKFMGVDGALQGRLWC